MRLSQEWLEALLELEQAVDDVRPMLTRRQARRLDDARETVAGILNIYPDDRPMPEPLSPETDSQS